MKCFPFLILWLFLALARPDLAPAEAPTANSDLATNAALQYWQAFALMPTLDKDQLKLLENGNTIPFDEAAVKLIDASRNSVMYLNRAAKLPRCDWGLDYNEGISLQMPHIAKCRDLARLAVLHARYEFEQRNWKAGRQTATSLMVLARHVGRDPFLLNLVVRYVLEGMVVDLVAPYVGEIKAPATHLSEMYGELPPAQTVSEAILHEKRFMLSSILKQLRDAEQRKAGGWRDLWKLLIESPETPESLKKINSLDQVTKLMDELLPIYDDVAKLTTLPKAEFDAQYPALQKKSKSANPMAEALLPAIDKLLAKEHRNRVRMEMLLTAIAVAQEGPDYLKQTKDPFGTGPFEYRALDKGFELKSKLLFEDKPVTLTVGERKR